MPVAKKRKISETSDRLEDTPNETATAPTTLVEPESEDHSASAEVLDNGSNGGSTNTDAAGKDQEDRRQRFKALQARAVSNFHHDPRWLQYVEKYHKN
jgi:hypothetical protein